MAQLTCFEWDPPHFALDIDGATQDPEPSTLSYEYIDCTSTKSWHHDMSSLHSRNASRRFCFSVPPVPRSWMIRSRKFIGHDDSCSACSSRRRFKDWSAVLRVMNSSSDSRTKPHGEPPGSTNQRGTLGILGPRSLTLIDNPKTTWVSVPSYKWIKPTYPTYNCFVSATKTIREMSHQVWFIMVCCKYIELVSGAYQLTHYN